MKVFRIDSLDDPRVAVYRDLKVRRAEREPARFVVESLMITQRLLASPLQVESVLTEERYAALLRDQLPEHVPLYVTTREQVHALAGFRFHRGVLACGRRPPAPELSGWLDHSQPATWTVCVGVQDPENLGSILRTSAAFGVRAVLLGEGCCDPYSRRIARTSMGANFQLAIRESPDLHADLTRLRTQGGVRLVATTLHPAALPLPALQAVARQAVLFGSEGHGLDPQWLDLCDLCLTIPIQAGVDSLNVSVAAGIVLHHLLRGENTRSTPADRP